MPVLKSKDCWRLFDWAYVLYLYMHSVFGKDLGGSWSNCVFERSIKRDMYKITVRIQQATWAKRNYPFYRYNYVQFTTETSLSRSSLSFIICSTPSKRVHCGFKDDSATWWHHFMASDWLNMHPSGNPGIVAPNIDIKKCKLQSVSQRLQQKLKNWKLYIRVLTDKRLPCE